MGGLQEGNPGFMTTGPSPWVMEGLQVTEAKPRRERKQVTWGDEVMDGALEQVVYIENCLHKSWWERMEWKKCLDPKTTEGGAAIGIALWYVMVASVLNLYNQMSIA